LDIFAIKIIVYRTSFLEPYLYISIHFKVLSYSKPSFLILKEKNSDKGKKGLS